MGMRDGTLSALGLGGLFSSAGSARPKSPAEQELVEAARLESLAQAKIARQYQAGTGLFQAAQSQASIEQYSNDYEQLMGLGSDYDESMGLRNTYNNRPVYITRTALSYPGSWNDYYAAMGYYQKQPEPTPEIEVKAAAGLRQIEV